MPDTGTTIWESAPPTTGTPTGQQMTAGTPPHDTRPVQQQNGNAPETIELCLKQGRLLYCRYLGTFPEVVFSPAGLEYTTPSPLHSFLAETVDFFILFCVNATIILHLSGMKDITKFITHFIVEEMDENTSMEDLQKMMAVALVYRVLVCEIFWGLGGATPGKIFLGLQVVTCDSSVLVRPNRVLVVPASNVTLSASTVRALNKNFLFSIFTTFFFFQHNRTVYDIVAGTIVVQHRGVR
ncbi:unnamed protein product [Oncorhynchus mykiss]|uniref:RDD domain-containing protein n=1 Tax=Oncorhynchus mykiss TaxID=8022 RepID=A0A060Y322_ONCMY|nr:unnamed protein product [Oncorhynchus mykiss]